MTKRETRAVAGLPPLAEDQHGKAAEERKNRSVRQFLWAARNHLRAAQAKAEAEYDAPATDEPSDPLVLFGWQEIAIHAGTATHMLLKAIVVQAGGPNDLGNWYNTFKRAVKHLPAIDLQEDAIKEVMRARNNAVHSAKPPSRDLALSVVSRTEVLADIVTRELRGAKAAFHEIDEFEHSVVVSRAMDEIAEAVKAEIAGAARAYTRRVGVLDSADAEALVEIERDAWLRKADPDLRYAERECPACPCKGFVVMEVELAEVDGDIREFARALCIEDPVCGLRLSASDWVFAGITDIYSDPDPDLFV